jgi:hypothetical protein
MIKLFRERSPTVPRPNDPRIVVTTEIHQQQRHQTRATTEARNETKIEQMYSSSDNQSYTTSETWMYSSFESCNGGHLESSSHSASDADVSSSFVENKTNDFFVDDMSSGDNRFGQSILTVWSVAPGFDCGSEIFPMGLEEDANILQEKNLYKDADNNLDVLDTSSTKRNRGEECENLSLQSRISMELDAFTYPKNKYYQRDNTNISAMQKKVHSGKGQRQRGQKHDPSAKFLFRVENKKERGRDPSVIEIFDDDNSNNNDSDDPMLFNLVPDRQRSSTPTRSSFSNNARPDPPASLTRPFYDKNTLQEKVTSMKGRQPHNKDQAMSSFFMQESHTLSLHALEAPTHKNKHRGGLFAWFYCKRVAV